jgi:molybdate transport system substrate-binding protein
MATALIAQPRREVVIAAASNLTDVFRDIGPQFEKDTGIHPVFSFASTAVLAQQAERGAPFDLIAAADEDHIKKLEQKSLLVPGSRAVYAYGSLALWLPHGALPVRQIADLVRPEIKVIAVAKPELAPYGNASVETLKRVGIWERVSPKIVYAENITMAKQYGISGNADAVLTAYPLVLHEAGSVIQVDSGLYKPIGQALGILVRSERKDAAAKFAEYILRGPGRLSLERFGYQLPQR